MMMRVVIMNLPLYLAVIPLPILRAGCGKLLSVSQSRAKFAFIPSLLIFSAFLFSKTEFVLLCF